MIQTPRVDPSRVRKPQVLVVLPAFNEEACIGRLLERIDYAMRISNQPYRILVVNDGSTDRTADIVAASATDLPVGMVTHETNRGLGATVHDGLFAAADAAEENDIIVTMDADDTHTPGLIMRMVRMIYEGYDVVIASRYCADSRVVGVPLRRRATSRAASLLLRVVLPIRGVKDYTCGYRAYRSSVIRLAIERFGADFANQDGFQCMVDILLRLRKLDLLFGEVPFVLRYDFKKGASKMKVGKTIRNTLLLILRRMLWG